MYLNINFDKLSIFMNYDKLLVYEYLTSRSLEGITNEDMTETGSLVIESLAPSLVQRLQIKLYRSVKNHAEVKTRKPPHIGTAFIL